jgi:hypothetical protein
MFFGFFLRPSGGASWEPGQGVNVLATSFARESIHLRREYILRSLRPVLYGQLDTPQEQSPRGGERRRRRTGDKHPPLISGLSSLTQSPRVRFFFFCRSHLPGLISIHSLRSRSGCPQRLACCWYGGDRSVRRRPGLVL